MSKVKESTQEFKNVRRMYNEHPFPNRTSVPDNKSDTRYKGIYEKFLNIPVDELEKITFLEAGSGTGDVTWTWRRLLPESADIVAVDLSENSIRIAKSAEGGTHLSPKFASASLLDLPLPDNSVDFVHCSGVLVAVTEPDKAYKELVRVLKPGGYMLLVLYHKYGRAIHGMRRAVVDMIEKEDVDRRAELGGKLFPRAMRKWGADENVPVENMLYDQYGLPCESRYSIKDGLDWFEQGDIEYIGTFPPVNWDQFGKGFRFSKQFEKLRGSGVGSMIMNAFPDNDAPPAGPPNFLNRLAMETFWFFNSQQLFSIAGRKRK